MGAALGVEVLPPGEPQVGLMDQDRGVERIARTPAVGELGVRQALEVRVEAIEELRLGSRSPLVRSGDQRRHVGHGHSRLDHDLLCPLRVKHFSSILLRHARLDTPRLAGETAGVNFTN